MSMFTILQYFPVWLFNKYFDLFVLKNFQELCRKRWYTIIYKIISRFLNENQFLLESWPVSLSGEIK
jgi:hypothetical protein